MIENDKEIRSTIRDVSYNIVCEIAPDESDFFYEISDAYFSDPESLKEKKSKEDPVGFGMEGVIEMISPATIGIVTTVITYIATEVFGAAKGALTDELKSRIKKLFNKDKTPESKSETVLTPEQLKQIRDKAISEGLALNLSQDKATGLANALIASMVIN